MTDIIAFLSQSETLPFSTSLVLMLLIGAISAIGIDFDMDLDTPALDVDAGAPDAGFHIVDWVNPGRMPIMAAFALFLMIYTLVGLIGQQVLEESAGMLPGWLAGLAAFPVAYIAWQPASRLIGRIMPKDHTEAVSMASLQGRRGQIEIGTATYEHPARVIVRDVYGTRHSLMARMSLPGQEAHANEEVYLLEVGKEGEPSVIAPAQTKTSLSL